MKQRKANMHFLRRTRWHNRWDIQIPPIKWTICIDVNVLSLWCHPRMRSPMHLWFLHIANDFEKQQLWTDAFHLCQHGGRVQNKAVMFPRSWGRRKAQPHSYSLTKMHWSRTCSPRYRNLKICTKVSTTHACSQRYTNLEHVLKGIAISEYWQRCTNMQHVDKGIVIS